VLDSWLARVGPGIAWAAPQAARCRGLLAADERFDDEFLDALRLHDDGDEFSRGRTMLRYGEALRRAARKTEAREQLRAAHARASPRLGDELTPQELQVALQVAAGKTNNEAGAALYLSPKTVEFHLARVFRKLDVSSRAEVIRRFAAESAAAEPVSV
jgi:DNA-binding NarL/FixJ family response regulator